jgi:hypothetical protein
MKLVGTDECKDTDRESNTLQNLKLHQVATLPSINKSFPHLLVVISHKLTQAYYAAKIKGWRHYSIHQLKYS